MAEEIKVRLIFEILGKPIEHVKESLNNLIIRLNSEKGVNILEKIEHEPKKVEKSSDLFTTFAEIEAEIDSLRALFGIIFAYFPSHLEVLSPRNLKIGNDDLNDLMNILIGRLHNYDAVAKKILAEREIIFKKFVQKGVDVEGIIRELAEESKSNETEKKSRKNNKKSKKKD